MDEAFMPFNEMIKGMSDLNANIYDADDGIHMYIDHFNIDTPIELDIITDENGKVHIGIIPPLYHVETSFQPSYHAIRFTAEKFDD
jgi:hypothetical protein